MLVSLHVRAALLFASSLGFAPAMAQETPWRGRLDLGALSGSYNDSINYDSFTQTAAYLSVDRYDRGGLTAYYSKDSIKGTPGAADIEQDNLFLDGRLYFKKHYAAHAAVYRVSNDARDVTHDIWAFASRLTYDNLDVGRLWDVGAAHADYGDSDLTIEQLTMSAGRWFNHGYDRARARLYAIHSSDKRYTQDKDNTFALELQWGHWFTPSNLLRVHSMQATALLGRRILALDPELGVVHNRPDLQTGAFHLSAQWRLGEHLDLLFGGGAYRYENRALLNEYRSLYGVVNLTYRW